MPQSSWTTCPRGTRTQVEGFTQILTHLLADNLVGVYLHGSLALGCFNPQRSDLDLLVVTQQPMNVETKHQVAAHLLDTSRAPHPIEISFLTHADLSPWQHPTPFDFHYSEDWRDRFEQHLRKERRQSWIDQPRKDPDLAAHVTITRQRGIRLRGVPIADLFPDVPRQDYLASILDDIQEALARIADDPVYAILNACRTYAFVRDGLVCSKQEGGAWALDVLPEALRPVVAQALESYAAGNADGRFDPAATANFATYISRRLPD